MKLPQGFTFNVEYPFLFRFRPDGMYAYNEFKNRQIFFQSLGNLNDPFEGHPRRLKLAIPKEAMVELGQKTKY